MNTGKRKRVYQKLALFLAFVMVISTLPMRAPALAAGIAPLTTFIGNGFTVNVVNHSSWATGHNTMFEITNTSSEVWYHWVFSVNRNLGLNIPTSWGTSWQNNGLFVHQDNS